MIWDILFVLSIMGICGAFFGRLLWKSEVESIRYKLFDVRDRLILAVAEKQLSKDSALFDYYYRSVNDVLYLTEKMHLEGLIQAWQADKRSKEELKAHDEQMKKVAAELQSSPEDVAKIVEDFYRIILDMLLINSNFYRLAYLLSRRHITHRIARWFERQDPKVASTYQDISDECKELGICANGAYAKAA